MISIAHSRPRLSGGCACDIRTVLQKIKRAPLASCGSDALCLYGQRRSIILDGPLAGKICVEVMARKKNPSRPRDRVFKIYMTVAAGVEEDGLLDFLEEAVVNYKKNDVRPDFDPDTVCVRRKSPKYADIKPQKYLGIV